LVSIELVEDKRPPGGWIGGDGAGDVFDKIRFRPGGATRGADNLAGSHVQIGNQRLCALPNILEFALFNLTWLARFGWCRSLQRLNASQFIHAQRMLTIGLTVRRLGIHGADGLTLLGKQHRVFFGRIEPVA
jgi:hypothetical protein